LSKSGLLAFMLTSAADGKEDERIDDEDLNGYLMYPKVFMDYRARHRLYGPVRVLPTRTFLYGMKPAEQITAEIDSGKRLEIVLQTVGATSDTGDVKVVLEHNGQPREIRVPNRSVKAKVAARPKVQDGTLRRLASPCQASSSGSSQHPARNWLREILFFRSKP
jgi:pyruvate carboxylase